MHVMKVKPAKQGVSSYFQGAHLSLELYSLDDLSEEDIEARLRAAGGAHQPDRFAFGSGVTVDAAEPPPVPSAPSVPAQATAPPVAAAGAGAGAGAEPQAGLRSPVVAAAAAAAPAAAAAAAPAAASSSPRPEAAAAAAPEGKQANNMFAAMSRQASSSSMQVRPTAIVKAAAAPSGKPREPFTMTFSVSEDKRAELIAALQAGNDLSITLYC
jgi:hypothetical protein